MKLSLPSINAEAVAMTFFLRQTTRKLWALLDRIGQENIRFLVANNRPLRDLPQVQAREAEIRKAALKYRPLAAKISEETFVRMLPPWLLQTVQDHGEPGRAWLQEQVRFLKGCFEEG